MDTMTMRMEEEAIDRVRDDPAAHRDCYPREAVYFAVTNLKAARDSLDKAIERIG